MGGGGITNGACGWHSESAILYSALDCCPEFFFLLIDPPTIY